MKKTSHEFRLQKVDILKQFEDDKREVAESRGFLTLEMGKYVEERGEMFGIFGNTVYWLLGHEDEEIAFLPAVLPNGELWAVWPDEGSYGVGVAHLSYLKKRDRETIIKTIPRYMTLAEFEKWRSEPVVHAGTQAAAVRAIGLDPVAMGGKVIDGQVFKPDACADARGECARCGNPGVWISGAGEYLCARHQDDY